MSSRVRKDIRHADLWRSAHKWPGSISVQWLWIKDIPNTQFIHIENPLNENKPVCQGRDCQEVYPKVGERMLYIFATFKPMTRIFDDFGIYDEQERHRNERLAFREKRANQKAIRESGGSDHHEHQQPRQFAAPQPRQQDGRMPHFKRGHHEQQQDYRQ